MINYNVYPDYNTRNKMISELCGRYKFLKRSYIGQSLCSRGIDVLRLGSCRNTVLLCGGFHGSEYLTILALIKFIDECARAYLNKSIEKNNIYDNLKNRGLSVVPCVNPDGTEIALHGSIGAKSYRALVEKIADDTTHWQANARGVDINHNFDAGWYELKQRELDMGINRPAPTRFGGTAPESEPETKALTKLCLTYDYCAALALHSQGREIYCTFGKNTPEASLKLAKAAAKASGYTVAQPEDIATGGGFKDWFIEKFGKPALTVEMGLGKNPLPLSDFESEYPILRKIFRTVLADC